MVYPVYEPPADGAGLTAAEAAEVERAALAVAAAANAKAKDDPAIAAKDALAEGCRALPAGYSAASSQLVREWVELECVCAPCGTLARPAPDTDPGGCFGWRVEAAKLPPTRPLDGDQLQADCLRQPVALVPDVFWVGRGSTCDLLITGQQVSSRHALLRRQGVGEVFITDHSTNGTFLNGRRLTKGVEERIKAGDEIEFGRNGGTDLPKTRYTYRTGWPTPTGIEEQALLDECWAALEAAGERECAGDPRASSAPATALTAAFKAASEQIALSVIGRLYDDVIRQSLRLESFAWVLYSCVPPTTRVLFESGALVKACAARRSPIDSEDFQVLASRHYCEVCHKMDDAGPSPAGATAILDGIRRVSPCKSCGVAAYCCPDHAHEDEARHRPWCKTLLLSRLLWQCALPTEQYERLRRCSPSSTRSSSPSSAYSFRCLGRPVGPNGHSRLPRWSPFWSAGWVGYFEAARELELPEAKTNVDAGRVGRLDQMLSTDSLSSILTVRYALHKLGLDREPSLTIYMLGAVFEASQPWVELLAWLPETHTLTLVLTGPDVSAGPPTTVHFEDKHANPERCLSNTIDGQAVRLTIHSINGLYHWLSTAQRDAIPPADVVFALHSGMNEYVSWTPTVTQLLSRNKTAPGAPAGTPNETPLVVTAWTPPEALAVHAMMLKCGGEVDPRFGLGPSANPWASLVPQRTIDHHGTTNFNNRYIQCMLPGGTIAAWTEDMDTEQDCDEDMCAEGSDSEGFEDDDDRSPVAKRRKPNHEHK